MPQPVPYLTFKGNCADAMRFYEKVLGGKIRMMMKTSESPMAAQCGPEAGDCIMHADLELEDHSHIYGGDAMPHMPPFNGVQGVSLTLNYDTVAQAESIFNALATGGNVTMPMGPSFWAKKFGMLVDKYGIAWIINGDRIPT